MLTEGTNVRPEADVEDEETTSPESDVERACAQVFRDTQGMPLAMYSAQNIDRLVTLFRAAKRSGRTFIMTLYGASIVEATGNSNIPGAGWPQVGVYVPGWQQAKVKKSGAFERVDRIKPFRVFVGPRRYSADFFHTRSSTCASPSAAFSSSTSSSSRRTCGFEPGRPPSANPACRPRGTAASSCRPTAPRPSSGGGLGDRQLATDDCNDEPELVFNRENNRMCHRALLQSGARKVTPLPDFVKQDMRARVSQ